MTDKQTFFQPSIRKCSSFDSQHIKLTYITHFYLNQGHCEAITNLLHTYQKYSADVLNHIHFVIVDDCSPIHCDLSHFDLNLTVLSINQDIAWNQGGARNLGVIYAKSDKILLTDIDHIFPEKTLRFLIKKNIYWKHFYKLWRKRDNGEILKPHSNIFLMSRGRFLFNYGYDEEFCGGYGAEDYRFVKFQKNHGSLQRKLPKDFFCVPRSDYNKMGSSHTLIRNFARNTPIDNRKRNELIQWGGNHGHSRLFLNFSWNVTLNKTRSRTSLHEPKVNTAWKKLGILRSAFSFLRIG